MKIVIVEDEIRIREGLMKLLERIDQNYQVVGEAENGKAGLELILESKPDLVITDVQMPIMDGLEMLRCLQIFSRDSRELHHDIGLLRGSL